MTRLQMVKGRECLVGCSIQGPWPRLPAAWPSWCAAEAVYSHVPSRWHGLRPSHQHYGDSRHHHS
jgi:hypothetical protein